MNDAAVENAPRAGQQTVEELARQQQLGMMQAAHTQFLVAITSTPPPSKMPVEVRRHMWHALAKTRQLFAPQTEEEELYYAEEK